MKHFGKLLLVALGFAVLTIALSSIPNYPAAAAPGGPTVTVVNTASNPVPVAPQGTTSIAGTVALASGTTVGISGTPNVNVANTPSVKEEGSPFATTLCVGTSSAACAGLPTSYSVASGKHLIIEYASGSCLLHGPASVARPFLTVTTGGSENFHYLAPFLAEQTASSGSTVNFEYAQQTRIYADPSTSVVLDVTSSTSGTGIFFCSEAISGRLVTP